eukprot:1136770-Pelagomonas_calceolata.AAC.2
MKTLAAPSEAVGVLCAQSPGTGYLGEAVGVLRAQPLGGPGMMVTTTIWWFAWWILCRLLPGGSWVTVTWWAWNDGHDYDLVVCLVDPLWAVDWWRLGHCHLVGLERWSQL